MIREPDPDRLPPEDDAPPRAWASNEGMALPPKESVVVDETDLTPGERRRSGQDVKPRWRRVSPR